MASDPDTLWPDYINALAHAANEAARNLGVEDTMTMEAMRAMQDLADALHKEGSFAVAKDLQGRVVCQLRSELGGTHPDARAALSKLELMVQTALLKSTLRNPPKSPIASQGYRLLGAWRETGDPMAWNALFSFVSQHMDDVSLASLRAFVLDFRSVSLMMASPSRDTEFFTTELKDDRQEAQLEAMVERFPKLHQYILFGYTFSDDEDD
jgi:hypothetical protein